jgi:hypothetical protein
MPHTSANDPVSLVVRSHYNRGVGYWWAYGSLDRLTQAGIEPYEVLQVLGYARRWPRRGVHLTGPVLTIWGRTRTGRALLVVLRPDPGTLDHQIVLARELTGEEEQQLQVWEAER